MKAVFARNRFHQWPSEADDGDDLLEELLA